MYQVFEIGRMYKVITTEGAKVIKIGNDEPILSKDEVLKELCRAIVEIEQQGCLISSVVELTPYRETPRVAFRNTKEYREAKRNTKKENNND